MKIKNLCIVAAVFVCMAAFSGCGRRIETYGENVSNRNITPIKDIISHPEQYSGRTVTVKGKIDVECSTGCWFNIKDGEDFIFTEIETSGFAIPQKVGRIAIVEGTISVDEDGATLTGKAIEIQ